MNVIRLNTHSAAHPFVLISSSLGPMAATDPAPELHPTVPVDFLWIPRPIRKFVGYVTMTAFACSFLVIPVSAIVLPLAFSSAPVLCGMWIASIFLSMLLPQTEWPAMRKLGQLWYELLQFSSNMNPDELIARIDEGDTSQFIIGM
jgi:hypothetical protein